MSYNSVSDATLLALGTLPALKELHLTGQQNAHAHIHIRTYRQIHIHTHTWASHALVCIYVHLCGFMNYPIFTKYSDCTRVHIPLARMHSSPIFPHPLQMYIQEVTKYTYVRSKFNSTPNPGFKVVDHAWYTCTHMRSFIFDLCM